MELGLCKGKKNYDKRAAASARDAKREIDRTLKQELQEEQRELTQSARK